MILCSRSLAYGASVSESALAAAALMNLVIQPPVVPYIHAKPQLRCVRVRWRARVRVRWYAYGADDVIELGE
jgi:hypothetical protein